MAQTYLLTTEHPLHRLQQRALVIGLGAGATVAVGAFLDPTQFFRSYLVAYLFWFGIALGSMTILMIHHIAGGAWSAVIRRLLESSTRTLPLLALLFLPLLLGLHRLYEWTHLEHVARDPMLQHKSAYLNIPFFLTRVAVYFAVWLGIMGLLNRWSSEQDTTGDEGIERRLQLLSRGGVVLLVLTMTFAAVDWVMSLQPHWYSTIFGILLMGGQMLTALALMIPFATALVEYGPLTNVITKEQFHDLGKMLFAFIMLWTYFSLSQFLIIWSANLPEETPWYLQRMQGTWMWIALSLVAFHFIVPFMLLLSRDVKRSPRILSVVSLGVFAICFVDLFWIIAPAFHEGGVVVHWLDGATVVGIGGVWLAAFVAQLKRKPLIPLHDAALPLLE